MRLTPPKLLSDVRDVFGLLIANIPRFDPTSRRIQIGRSMIAGAQLSILTLTTWPNLTADIVGRASEGYCGGGLRKVSMFCLGGDSPQSAGVWVGVIIALLVIAGFAPRVTAPLHAWMAISMNASLSLPDGGEAVASFATVILVLICLPDNRLFAWSRARKPISRPLGAVAYAASIGLCIQLAGVYFESGLAKIAVSEWLDGSAMYFIVRDPYFGATGVVGAVLRSLTDIPAGTALFTWGTIVLECVLAILLILPSRWKQYAFVGVAVLHLGIAVALGLWSFSLIMVGVACVATYRLMPPTPREAGDAVASHGRESEGSRSGGMAPPVPQTARSGEHRPEEVATEENVSW